ncbi:lysophospholipase [Cantharellus anzutake]|uniref:lysophospholipase n=1 Tax=Cantharellus anzutake TaxID=1750568 RepID=UPI001908FF3F|nr:lysophospholipase [Cantharellus anzutake]KAF8328238.1 lysophospholipase [Cantharellus anzutake]
MAAPYKEAWITGSHDNSPFYTRTYDLPDAQVRPKAHLIFIHGFIEHIGRYSSIFPGWVERGITVFAFDQRGFGLTATDKDNKSTKASYSKTSWKDQMEDISFFILRERERLGPSIPFFLMGHSMGGGEVLGFVCAPPVHVKALGELKGIIASAPMLRETKPSPVWQVFLGGQLAKLLPHKEVPVPLNSADLSHDPVVVEKYDNDPLVRKFGTLKGVTDMLNQGAALVDKHYVNWPERLPLLILHGDADGSTSPRASKEFFDKLKAKVKHYSSYPGAYHEIHNEPGGVSDKSINECISWVEVQTSNSQEQQKL